MSTILSADVTLVSWSLMLMGLGGFGAMLRARRAQPVAVPVRTNRF